jgi:hypothetical protein
MPKDELLPLLKPIAAPSMENKEMIAPISKPIKEYSTPKVLATDIGPIFRRQMVPLVIPFVVGLIVV